MEGCKRGSVLFRGGKVCAKAGEVKDQGLPGEQDQLVQGCKTQMPGVRSEPKGSGGDRGGLESTHARCPKGGPCSPTGASGSAQVGFQVSPKEGGKWTSKNIQDFSGGLMTKTPCP